MCGIAGLFQAKAQPVDMSILKRMNDSMIHRGPDSEGFWSRGAVGLGMRRLKVIDLSTGDQPMHDGSEKVWIIFNGEIYNYRELRSDLEKKGHRFSTQSDTEVLLRQYLQDGDACVQSLKGMFGFAIYDSRTDALFIGRDRLGVKPLFYSQTQDGFAFASEIKPLLQVPWIPKSVNLQAISHFLSLNYLPSPWTPFQGIVQLPPGHWLKFHDQKLTIKQYWDVPWDAREESEENALKRIGELLHISMERRLIADVPIGAFLSGGLDSSALVYLMKEQRHGVIQTFSVGFDQASYDETPFAREVSRQFGTEHHEIQCNSGDFTRDFSRLSWHADNLLGDQAALPLYQVSRLAKQYVTVCLSGDGGDELFVGYPTFHANRYHQIYSRLPEWIRRGLVDPAVGLLPGSSEKLSFEYKAKKFIEAGGFDSGKAHYWWRTVFSDEEKRRLLTPHALASLQIDSSSLYTQFIDRGQSGDIQAACLYADLKVWLAGNNLYKIDTMTMAHGLEARVPFLDHELVEYMAHLPMSLKYKNNALKYLLKKWLKGKLPDSVLHRKKSGWHSPIAAWFKGPLSGWLRQALDREHPLWSPVFNRSEIRRLMDEHTVGRHNHSFKLWGLLTLYAWADHFFSPVPDRGVDR